MLNTCIKKFSKFRKTYLKQTEKEYNSVEELKNNLPNADVYCTGSDQVWAKIGGVNYDEAYFFKLCARGKKVHIICGKFRKKQDR